MFGMSRFREGRRRLLMKSFFDKKIGKGIFNTFREEEHFPECPLGPASCRFLFAVHASIFTVNSRRDNDVVLAGACATCLR